MSLHYWKYVSYWNKCYNTICCGRQPHRLYSAWLLPYGILRLHKVWLHEVTIYPHTFILCHAIPITLWPSTTTLTVALDLSACGQAMRHKTQLITRHTFTVMFHDRISLLARNRAYQWKWTHDGIWQACNLEIRHICKSRPYIRIH